MGRLSDTKGKFSRILVAIDGSSPSMDGADYAIEMAKKNNAQLIALTVSRISLSVYGLGPSPDALTRAKERHKLEVSNGLINLIKAQNKRCSIKNRTR